jgi:surface antigen
MKPIRTINRALTLVIVATAVAAGTAFTGNTLTANGHWQILEDRSLGYSLLYPSDEWEARLTINNKDTLLPEVIRRRVTLFGPNRGEINIDVWSNPGRLSVQDWFDQFLGEAQVPSTPGSNRVRRNVDGESVISITRSQANGEITFRSTGFVHQDLAYRVEYIDSDGGQSLAVYESILSSFRFVSATEPLSWVPDIPTGLPDESTLAPQDCYCNISGGCDNCCGISDPGNPFPCCNGNCTWYAYYRWNHTGPQPRPHDLAAVRWHDAKDWYPAAVSAGYATGTTPAVDAIAIWQPGVCQFGWCSNSGLGHVGYVIQVAGDTFTFQSMDWNGNCGIWTDGPGQKDTTPNPITGYPNVTFIYNTNPCCCSQVVSCRAAQVEHGESILVDSRTPTDLGTVVVSTPLSAIDFTPTPSPMILLDPVEGEENITVTFPISVHRTPIEPQRTPPASASYRIPRSVFGSGGGIKQSAHYVMNSTQGQSTDLSRRTSASYVLVPGYWSSTTTGGYKVYLPLVIKGR